MKLFLKIIVAISILSLPACALIFKGEQVGVQFNSNPAGAAILIDGVKMGTTPTRLALKTNRNYTITFKHKGYKEQTYVLNNKIGALWIVLDVLSGGVPLIIDAATGAWYEFDTDTVTATLTPGTMNYSPLPKWASKLMTQ